MNYELYGDETSPNSCFIKTPLGVMLTGPIERLLANRRYLPSVDDTGLFTGSVQSPVTGLAARDATATVSSTGADSLACKSEAANDDAGEHCSDRRTCLNYLACDDSQSPDIFEFSIPELDDLYKDTVSVHQSDFQPIDTETNLKIIDYVLENTSRNENGNLVMPLTWNCKNAHMLSRNFNLAKRILYSTYDKIASDKEKLLLYDEVFKEQLASGIIEKIENIDSFIEQNPNCAFLAHTAVYRMARDTTKCRVVMLSNLSEKFANKFNVSHCQAILPGPCLNHKISTALMLLRFDPKFIIFDLKKAFLNIKLREQDSNRLCFLWFNNVEKGDMSLVAYKSLSLSFGLRCSPTILMLGLYKILMLDSKVNPHLNEMKRDVYNTIYVDNGSWSCADEEGLANSYKELSQIFAPYNFGLQQFCTNSTALQDTIDVESGTTTPEEVKLFGMVYNRINDTIKPAKLFLNPEADTKRKILQTLNSIYDLHSIYGPLLLRSKLFMQKLYQSQIGWDEKLGDKLVHEWRLIAKQVNSSPHIEISRNVGNRNGRFALICFSDASNEALGAVVYIKDLDTQKVSFWCAKSRIVSQDLAKRSMPQLELIAIDYGVELLQDSYESLAGESIVRKVNVESLEIFSDSLACVQWIGKYTNKFAKIQKLAVIVQNKLKSIESRCRENKVVFRHIEGEINPADKLTRPCGYKTLMKSSYISGPKFLSTAYQTNDLFKDCVIVPNMDYRNVDEADFSCNTVVGENTEVNPVGKTDVFSLIPIEKYSSFNRMVGILAKVLRFVNRLKSKVNAKCNRNWSVFPKCTNIFLLSQSLIVSQVQRETYPDVFSYYASNSKVLKNIPALVTQLNLFVDKNHVVRVNSKFGDGNMWPILLPKKSILTSLIVREIHENMGHRGIYTVLRELGKQFWVTNRFSVVNKVLSSCVLCRSLNAKPIALNQSPYRDFRLKPEEIPFRTVALDYIGPFTVKWEGQKRKVYLLIVTCLWSRAINLLPCLAADVQNFLMAVQRHLHQYGAFSFCLSDQGSQIKAGANIIRSFLDDLETREFLESHGINEIQFKNYPKGNSALGSLVESLVKQTKHMMCKAIRSNVLNFWDFDFLVSKSICLINKRPIAMKDALRSDDVEDPVITPELIITGYESAVVNVIPDLQPAEDVYEDVYPGVIRQKHSNLCRVREKLRQIYHEEFLSTLISQAVDKRGRYKQVRHRALRAGDVVLLRDEYTKAYNYPMARVVSVETNDIGEVTAARVKKGLTGETVYRHTSSLIHLLSGEDAQEPGDCAKNADDKEGATASMARQSVSISQEAPNVRPPRKTAQSCRAMINALIKEQNL